MIRTIKVELNAAYPNMPLEPVNVFAGSAASFTICNVPRAVGDRAITSVSLVLKKRDASSQTLPAVRVGSAWEVTIPASSLPLPYSSSLGVKIVGSGLDENKSAATWVLGAADLHVLNQQGQVTPGADAGDMKHSEFSDLDPDTASLADVITRLKGTAMIAFATFFAISAFAALPVTPVYTNHNRVAGNVQTMTNIQSWASAVEAAIDRGGVDTNAVISISANQITNNVAPWAMAGKSEPQGMSGGTVTNIVDGIVASSNLCTVAAAEAMRDTRLPATYQDDMWMVTSLSQFVGGLSVMSEATFGTSVSFLGDTSFLDWENIKSGTQTLPSYLTSLAWHPSSATLANYGITDAYTKSETDEAIEVKRDKTDFYIGTRTFSPWSVSPATHEGYEVTVVWISPESGTYYARGWHFCYVNQPPFDDVLSTDYYAVSLSGSIAGSQFSATRTETTDTIAKTSQIPTSLPNPKALTFTGAASGSYDGSAEKTVNIPSTDAIERSVASVSNRQDTLEGYVAGQRVRVSVTNYYGNTSGQLPRLRIEEFITATNVTDGVATETNYWQIVWDEQSKYDRFLVEATAAISAMTNNLYQTYYQLLQERLATKAPRAWGTLTSAGEAAPAGSVWHTEPNTVFAGGTEYAHAMVGTGVIGVLTTKGAAVYTDGETGRFHFTTDDKTAYFGMNIATRYELGCATDGITVTPVGGNNMVDLLYNVTMSGKPILYYTPTLTQPITWEQITDSSGGAIPGATVYASWDAAPPAGSEICTINCGAGVSGFFKAAIEYAGVSKFETNMMADLAGGIVATNQTSGQSQPVEPYINNGNVLWRVKP